MDQSNQEQVLEFEDSQVDHGRWNFSIIVTLDVSHTVSEILTHKARRALTRDPTVL